MSKLKAQGNASGTGVFTLQTPPTNTDRTISLPDSTGTLVDTTGATFTGAVTGTDVTLSGGVYVGGTGSANYLDDYETGTFTTTLTPSTSGTVTLKSTEDILAYTKIGRQVTITGRLRVESVSSPVGTLLFLGNLPFVCSDLSEKGGVSGPCSVYSDNGSQTFNAMPMYIAESASTANLYLTVGNVNSNYRIHFSFSYFTT